MSAPIVIHVLRPYGSEEEYLREESFSISARSMLLIDQPPLPLETVVVFDVSLSSGQKPIRAEGKVVAHVVGDARGPGGLRVRFKRFGAATKAFIDRATAVSAMPSLLPRALNSLPPREAELPSEGGMKIAPSSPLDRVEKEHRDGQETSGVHIKVRTSVAAPPNREALLARLRSRRAG